MQKWLSKWVLIVSVAVPSGVWAQDAAPDPVLDAADGLLDLADSVLTAIELQRGVDSTSPIATAVHTRDALRERVLAMLGEEYAPWELAATDRLLKALGVLAPEDDYVELTLDLLTEQIAGFYDPRRAVLYVLDDMDPSMQPGIMAHELYHAIQDQRWGIEALRGRSDRVTDVSLARTAVLEGDALGVMIEYGLDGSMRPWEVPMLDALVSTAMPDSSAAGASSAPPIPEVLWAQLVFPYGGGLRLVAHMGQMAGWRAVDRIYEDMPDSTEQVLHPERYLDRDAPTWLEFTVGDALAGQRYAVDTLGELTIQAMLQQLLVDQVSASACARAAAGWDGDRLEAWSLGPDRDVLVWLTVWDSSDEATAFFAVAERLGSAWMPDASGSSARGNHGGASLWEGAAGRVWVEHWGDLVLLVSDRGSGRAMGRAEMRELVEQVWASHARSGYPSSL